jgi:hypothetical protein
LQLPKGARGDRSRAIASQQHEPRENRRHGGTAGACIRLLVPTVHAAEWLGALKGSRCVFQALTLSSLRLQPPATLAISFGNCGSLADTPDNLPRLRPRKGFVMAAEQARAISYPPSRRLGPRFRTGAPTEW